MHSYFTSGISSQLLGCMNQNPETCNETKTSLIASLPILGAVLPSNSDLLHENIQLVREAVESLKTINYKDVCVVILSLKTGISAGDRAASTKGILKCLSRIIILHAVASSDKLLGSNDRTDTKSGKRHNSSRPRSCRILLGLLEDPLVAWDQCGVDGFTQQAGSSCCDQMVDIVQEIEFEDEMLRSPSIRKVLWDFLILVCMICPSDCLERLATVRIQIDNEVVGNEAANAIVNNNSEHPTTSRRSKVNKPTSVLG